MKRTIIMLFVCGGLLAGCNTNKGGSKAFGKKGSSAAASSYRVPGQTRKISSDNTVKDSLSTNASNQASAKLDSLLPTSGAYSKPYVNYQGATGFGMGGSYASASYRHDELNRKKHEERALAKMKERNQMNQNIQPDDSLTSQADSTQYVW